ncbi:MAG: DUF6152 family protein [Gammaproteobacteria bacterium]
MIAPAYERIFRSQLMLRGLLAISVLLSATRVLAHHGAAAHYDPDDQVTLTGVVTDLQFVNPHSFVHIEVAEDGGGVVTWRCELSGATQLIRRGWTRDTLAEGHRITVTGGRARREVNSCDIETLVFNDGRFVDEGESIEGVAVPRQIASEDEVANRPRYLANGQPNMSGSWVAQNGGGTGGETPDGPPEPTPAGLEASERFDFRFDNPVIRCESGNIITDWYRQQHVNDIEQQDDRVIVRYGYLDLERTIHLGVEEHPDEITPSVEGHSIGRWEGETLIVETVGFIERALHPRQEIMISDQTRIVERFTYDHESRTLTRDFTVNDPLYLAKAFRGINVADVAAWEYRPFECVDLSGDNNRRPE